LGSVLPENIAPVVGPHAFKIADPDLSTTVGIAPVFLFLVGGGG